VKPVKIFKRLGAAFAAAFIVLGVAAGTASAASADAADNSSVVYQVRGNSGDLQ
jgi:hypothetical protein